MANSQAASPRARLAFGVVLPTALVVIAVLAGPTAAAGSAPFLVALTTVVFSGAGPDEPTASATHRYLDPPGPEG